jgi:phosphocarrier protein HPr
MSDATAISQTAVVGSSVGLHARPATLIAQRAATLGAQIRIGNTGKAPVDARSALLLMTLGASQGDEVLVEAEGPDAESALAEIVAMVESDLDRTDE